MKLPQGMAYGNWDFSVPFLEDLTYKIEILHDIDHSPGRYYQLYDGDIVGVGSYFGLQTNVFNPSNGKYQGPGLIFSRWQTRDISNTRVVPSGFHQISGHEGNFVGVRNLVPWSVGKYLCTLVVVDEDESGVWYEFAAMDLATNQKYSAGCLRFPSAKISSGGGTWTEAYSIGRNESEVPETEMRILSLTANRSNLHPVKCRLSYGEFPNSDAYMNNGILILRSGQGVIREHEATEYILN